MRIPFFLLRAHLRRTWLRTLLTTGSVFVAVLIFGFLRTFIVGMESTLADSNPSRIITGSAISLFAQLPVRLEPELAVVPGVEQATHWTWFGGVYVDDSPDHMWGRFGVDVPSFREVYGPDVILSDDAWEEFTSTRTACIIGKGLAEKESLGIGDNVPLLGNIFPGVLELQVAGIYESKVKSFDENTLFFHWDYMNEVSRREGGRADVVSTYTLFLDTPSRAAEVSQTIDATYESSDHRTRTLTERMFQAQFSSMWGNLPLFFTVLGSAVMVACLMVTANTMVLNARERVQEVGILKTLGFTPLSVGVMALVEGILVCLVGGGLAMLFVRSLDGATMIFVPAVVPWSTVFEGLAIALGLGIFSGIAPALMASRLNIVEALRRRA
jgi:putative ABC transport system permease protein